MSIKTFDKSMISEVVGLWNSSMGDELYYKPLTESEFTTKFIENPNFDYKHTFVYYLQDKIVGFANGICKKVFNAGETSENTPAYITMILVGKENRREGIGSKLLLELEKSFVSVGKKTADILFFNPINLQWYVPNTDHFQHPNSPGVLKNSSGHKFFASKGYVDRIEQNSYCMDLKLLEPSETTIKNLQRLKDENITIEPYNENLHYELNELFDNFNNEVWRNEIMNSVKNYKERPVIIVSDMGKVCGFTGPLYVEESGRGYFAGIGVHSDLNGRGIGSVLFYKLCEGLKDEGAKYMTLFTGVNNPAKKIYERTGFEVVATWVDMRKEL